MVIDPAKQLNEAFDKSTLTFKDRAATLAAFKENREIVTSDDDGQLYSRYDGEVLPLDECLLRYGLDNRRQIDGRSAPRTGAGGRSVELTKSEMTTREKVSFIATHGADAFEKLATHPVETRELKTQADWLKLPLAEKVRRTKENPRAFEELPAAPTGQIKGSYINHAALERQAKIRPGSKRQG